ncbi:MAG: outer membrane beta-barrel protein [Saprospiraceae bacterium]|nr:outer membrane beta-barrel protein [Lewinellaceae bacterium]
MKKIALAFGFLLVFQVISSAQEEIRFGIQASPTWSWMRTNDKFLESTGSNWGLKFGVVGEYYFTYNYAFMAGLGFGFNHGGTLLNGYQQGSFWPKTDLSDPRLDTLSKDAKLHYRVTYVEVPFGLRFRGGSNEDSRMKFYAEAPIFTLGFVSKALGDIRGNTPIQSDDENIRKDVNGLSLSWGVGAGIEYELASNATVVAGLYFQQQFTDLTDDSGSVFDSGANTWKKEDSKGAFNALSLRLGFFF